MSTPEFEDVYARTRTQVLAVCLQVTGDRVLAEDAFQETYFLVCKHLSGFRGESQVSTWVFRIALRVSERVRGRERAASARATSPRSVDRARAASSPNLVDIPSADEAWRRLRAAFDQLSEDQRDLLTLMAVRELSTAIIADVLEVPVGTVYSRAHAARRALADAVRRLEQAH